MGEGAIEIRTKMGDEIGREHVFNKEVAIAVKLFDPLGDSRWVRRGVGEVICRGDNDILLLGAYRRSGPSGRRLNGKLNNR